MHFRHIHVIFHTDDFDTNMCSGVYAVLVKVVETQNLGKEEFPFLHILLSHFEILLISVVCLSKIKAVLLKYFNKTLWLPELHASRRSSLPKVHAVCLF